MRLSDVVASGEQFVIDRALSMSGNRSVGEVFESNIDYLKNADGDLGWRSLELVGSFLNPARDNFYPGGPEDIVMEDALDPRRQVYHLDIRHVIPEMNDPTFNKGVFSTPGSRLATIFGAISKPPVLLFPLVTTYNTIFEGPIEAMRSCPRDLAISGIVMGVGLPLRNLFRKKHNDKIEESVLEDIMRFKTRKYTHRVVVDGDVRRVVPYYRKGMNWRSQPLETPQMPEIE